MVGYNNINSSSHSPGGAEVQGQGISRLTLPLDAPGEIPFLTSFSFWRLQVPLAGTASLQSLLVFTWLPSLLCFHSVSLLRTFVIGFRAHPDNPG